MPDDEADVGISQQRRMDFNEELERGAAIRRAGEAECEGVRRVLEETN